MQYKFFTTTTMQNTLIKWSSDF